MYLLKESIVKAEQLCLDSTVKYHEVPKLDKESIEKMILKFVVDLLGDFSLVSKAS